MDLGAARDTLKAALSVIPGLTAYDTVPPKPEVPCAILHPGLIIPGATFDKGTADINFNVQILVQLADWSTAQDALDAYISTGTGFSVVDAVEDDEATITVESIDNYGIVPVGETSYAGVTFHVQVLA